MSDIKTWSSAAARNKQLMTGRSDELTRPWARQSIVQLAPVWGRITDPQTVQTTTSDQSE